MMLNKMKIRNKGSGPSGNAPIWYQHQSFFFYLSDFDKSLWCLKLIFFPFGRVLEFNSAFLTSCCYSVLAHNYIWIKTCFENLKLTCSCKSLIKDWIKKGPFRSCFCIFRDRFEIQAQSSAKKSVFCVQS